MSRRPRLLLALVALTVLAPPLTGWTQVLLKRSDKDFPVDAETRRQVIETAIEKLEQRYVFPEVAEKIAEDLEARLERGDYDDVDSGQAFAKRLTEDLQSIANDRHLRVMASADPLPQMPQRREPSEEDKARMRDMARKVNAHVERAERLPGNVGYLKINGFMDAEALDEPLAAAMNFLANTDALIIDLRHNGGGSPTGVALLCSYLFGDKPVHLNDLYWREGDRTEEFWTREEVAGRRFLDKPVYVLTSSRTFSAAEECAYNLQTQRRATIVGETTGGGANPGGAARLTDHFLMFVPSGRAINPITKTNWEGVGVKPEIEAPAEKALEVAHQEAIKHLKERADDETRRLIEMDLETHAERARK